MTLGLNSNAAAYFQVCNRREPTNRLIFLTAQVLSLSTTPPSPLLTRVGTNFRSGAEDEPILISMLLMVVREETQL